MRFKCLFSVCFFDFQIFVNDYHWKISENIADWLIISFSNKSFQSLSCNLKSMRIYQQYASSQSSYQYTFQSLLEELFQLPGLFTELITLICQLLTKQLKYHKNTVQHIFFSFNLIKLWIPQFILQFFRKPKKKKVWN